jgi:hypothetical protein
VDLGHARKPRRHRIFAAFALGGPPSSFFGRRSRATDVAEKTRNISGRPPIRARLLVKGVPMAFGCHLRLRPINSVPLLRTAETRRTVARVVLERARDFELTCFSAAESHLHAHNGADRAATMELGRRIEIALTRRLPDVTGFNTAYVEAVRDESHLYNTCRYILRQDERQPSR